LRRYRPVRLRWDWLLRGPGLGLHCSLAVGTNDDVSSEAGLSLGLVFNDRGKALKGLAKALAL
jgi:hypothetical protein